MNNRYDFKEIENKWRAEWEKNPINKEDDVKPRFYCLDMFPYPSGTGLHVWDGMLSVCLLKTLPSKTICIHVLQQQKISKM